MSKPQIKVEVLFYRGSGESPRTFYSFYRPAFKFDSSKEFNSGEFEFINADKVLAGERIESYIRFLKPARVQSYLDVGATFKFHEGDKPLGECKIVEVYINLETAFYQLFIRTFPDLKTEIEKGIIQPHHFSFSIKAPYEPFGKLQFDIDNDEITVFSKFSHSHFNTDIYTEVEDEGERIKLVCNTAIEYIRAVISGEIIVEFLQQGGKVLRAIEFHKDNPFSLCAATINLNESHDPMISKLLRFFKSSFKKNIVRKRISWHGEVPMPK